MAVTIVAAVATAVLAAPIGIAAITEVAGEAITTEAAGAAVTEAAAEAITAETAGAAEAFVGAGEEAAVGVGAAETTETTALVPYQPPNLGALGSWSARTLQVGEEIDRIGLEEGFFASPAGTPIEMRSLAPGFEDLPYNVYRVAEELEVQESVVAPWYGQFGLGIQYRLPQTVAELAKPGGYLVRITP